MSVLRNNLSSSCLDLPYLLTVDRDQIDYIIVKFDVGKPVIAGSYLGVPSTVMLGFFLTGVAMICSSRLFASCA